VISEEKLIRSHEEENGSMLSMEEKEMAPERTPSQVVKIHW
jgi:hypothetical protein